MDEQRTQFCVRCSSIVIFLFALLMAFFLMMFQYGAGRNFLGPVAVTSALFGRFFYVFIHAFLFIADAAQRFFLLFLRHMCILLCVNDNILFIETRSRTQKS